MVSDTGVKYETVSSSNLLAVGYDEENANLFIVFKNKKTGKPGRKYVYYHVPRHVFDELLAADSKGVYHGAYVKNVYSYDEIGGN